MRRRHLIALLVGVVLALALSVYPRWSYGMPDRRQDLYPGVTPDLAGYGEVIDDLYTPIDDDPQLLFAMDGRTVSTLQVIFSEGLEAETPVQLYYAVEGAALREEASVATVAMPGDREVLLTVPADVYALLRLDVNGPMRLAGVVTSPDGPKEYPGLAVRWQLLLGCALLLTAVSLYWHLRQTSPRETLVEVRITPAAAAKTATRRARWRPRPGQVAQVLIVAAVFAFSLTLALDMPSSLAPDERMRADVPLWIFRNGALPVGDEPDLVDPIWGFSYAFAPFLPSLLALPLMWVCSLFTGPEESLLLALRLVSVLAATGSAALCFPIGRRVFRRGETVYLFAVLVGFLPQFIFLGGYFNNDAFSLFTVLLILCLLLRGRERHWDVKSCAGLGVAISLCMLTYYFAYGWVLLSVPFCVASVLRDKTIEKKGAFLARRICLVAAVVLCLTGWYFIRNAYLYDGDFLALSASGKCAAAYEQATGLSVLHLPTLAATGVGLGEMLFGMGWIKTTLRSLVGGFGYMNIFLSDGLYALYFFLLAGGLLCGLYRFLKRPGHVLELFLLSLGGVIPVVCSIYFSYTSGFQPQGRYIFAALPALTLLTSLGYEQAAIFLTRHRRTGRVSVTRPGQAAPVTFTLGVNPTVLVTLLWLALFAVVWTTVMAPQLLVA